jgi:hypothetical protein
MRMILKIVCVDTSTGNSDDFLKGKKERRRGSSENTNDE